MIEDKEMIKVINRDNGSVGYSIPDLGNLRRHYESGEAKMVTMEELRKLSYLPGGDVLLRDYLVVTDPRAVEELLGEVEPEYRYEKKDVQNLLLTGSVDELKDCLDFAPQGVIDLVKDEAVNLKINDIAKRKAIKDSTGFNVDRAILVNEESAEGEEEKEAPTKRRVAIPGDKNSEAPKRRIIHTV